METKFFQLFSIRICLWNRPFLFINVSFTLLCSPCINWQVLSCCWHSCIINILWTLICLSVWLIIAGPLLFENQLTKLTQSFAPQLSPFTKELERQLLLTNNVPYNTVNRRRRKIRLMESNLKCRHRKKFTCKGTFGWCLSVWGPHPPPATHCLYFGEGGGRRTREKVTGYKNV